MDVVDVAAAPAFWGVIVAFEDVLFGDVAIPTFWGLRDALDDVADDAVDAATLPAFWGCVGERAVDEIGDVVRPRAFCVVGGLFGCEADDRFCEDIMANVFGLMVD